jgi:hypothetical protein
MAHSAQYDDDFWKWAQSESGLRNPASWIRALTYRAQRDYIDSKAAGATDERSILDPEPQTDRGHPFIATRMSMCDECGDLIDVGDKAIVYTDADGKKYIHAWHRQGREQT